MLANARKDHSSPLIRPMVYAKLQKQCTIGNLMTLYKKKIKKKRKKSYIELCYL